MMSDMAIAILISGIAGMASSALTSALNTYTDVELQDAQIAADKELSAQEYEQSSALSAQDYQQQLALQQDEQSNKYQRQVADMRAAGLNVGAIGGDSSTSSTSSGSSGTTGLSQGQKSSSGNMQGGANPTSAVALAGMIKTAQHHEKEFKSNVYESGNNIATNAIKAMTDRQNSTSKR